MKMTSGVMSRLNLLAKGRMSRKMLISSNSRETILHRTKKATEGFQENIILDSPETDIPAPSEQEIKKKRKKRRAGYVIRR